MIKGGVVLGVALWDGVQPWDPVESGLCDSTVDVTARPEVGPDWAYASGAFAAPASPAPSPDPARFVLAVVKDPMIAAVTKVAVPPWMTVLGAAISAGEADVIATEWADLCKAVPIPAADQALVHGYATTYGIPGI